MPSNHKPPTIAFPKNWAAYVKSAVLHVISLAQFATAYTRGWAADSVNARVRLKAEVERLMAEVALLCEEIRIKDARAARIDPHRRPHYPPTERMAILELRAARGWSLQQTAGVFQVTPVTIASWTKRINEHGPDALVQIRQPVNRFPDFIRYMAQRLKTLCPAMGKKKMAETLARAGLHIGATTIGRMLKQKPAPAPHPSYETESTGHVVTARRPNHVWHVDLTIVPTAAGFWCSWQPFALPQCWPFCWCLAAIVDHHSRRFMGFALFRQQPTSEAVRAFLGRTVAANDAKPKYIICDKGSQFWCAGFKAWCQRKRETKEKERERGHSTFRQRSKSRMSPLSLGKELRPLSLLQFWLANLGPNTIAPVPFFALTRHPYGVSHSVDEYTRFDRRCRSIDQVHELLTFYFLSFAGLLHEAFQKVIRAANRIDSNLLSLR